MKLFSRNEVNTKRQFEFDFAKAVCILGMVFVHCFEEFPLTQAGYSGSLYYTFVVVLDAIFGAGTFMVCLGIGLSFTKNTEPDHFIKRGLTTFLLGYILNVFRFVVPFSVYFLTGEIVDTLEYLLNCLLYTDIMQFAGLAFLLFGLLKKIKVPDWGIAIIALAMSITGSFVRFINVNNIEVSEILGLFVGTYDPTAMYEYYSPFPLLNWFILVVFGYFFSKLIRRVENVELFYAISTSVSAVIIAVYMALAIPNRYGMMSGDTIYYFQMVTWEAFIIMMGAVFAFGLYHYLSKLLNEPIKRVITSLSTNINKTYCIHWVLIGVTEVFLWALFEDGLSTYVVLIAAFIIYLASTLLAEWYRRHKENKKVKKDEREPNNI